MIILPNTLVFPISPCPGSLASSSSAGQGKQGGSNSSYSGSTSTRVQVTGSNDTKQHLTGHSSNSFNSPGVTSVNTGANGINKSELATPISMEVQPSTYSTALTVTITIGVSLLVLNMLLFFGLYYHMDRRKEGPANNSRQGNGNQDCSANGSDETANLNHHHNSHNPSMDKQQYYSKSRNRNTVTFNEVCNKLFLKD